MTARKGGRPSKYEPVDTPEAAAKVLRRTIPDDELRVRIGMRAGLAMELFRARKHAERVVAKLRSEKNAVLDIINARLSELERTPPQARPETPDVIHLLKALEERDDAYAKAAGSFYLAGYEDLPRTEAGAVAWALHDQPVTPSDLAMLTVAMGWSAPHYPSPLAGRRPSEREHERALARFETSRNAHDQALRRARKFQGSLTRVLNRARGVGGPFRLPGVEPG